MQKFPYESEFLEIMKKGHVPGMSIIMIENGEIERHSKYGLKNARADDPIDDNTVYEAASLSKPIFAYAILQMVEEGVLHLDTPLFEYFPYPYVENDERFKVITARMVLTHTTGFPNWRRGEPLQIYFQPGTKFSYSGEGFFYLQKVVEYVLGHSIEEYLKKRVFQPLGMIHSSFIWQNEYEKILATGHNGEGTPMKNQRFLSANAAFTLYTTAVDYAKFISAIMNGIGLQPETFNQMLSSQIMVEKGCVNCVHKQLGELSESISWGLGWGLQQLVQGDSFWHWGDNDGFKCYVVLLRKEKKGIIIFTNSSNEIGLSIIPQIINKIWGASQPAFDWIDTEKEPF